MKKDRSISGRLVDYLKVTLPTVEGLISDEDREIISQYNAEADRLTAQMESLYPQGIPDEVVDKITEEAGSSIPGLDEALARQEEMEIAVRKSEKGNVQ